MLCWNGGREVPFVVGTRCKPGFCVKGIDINRYEVTFENKLALFGEELKE